MQEFAKKEATYAALFGVAFVLLFWCTLFILGWYDHSKMVQGWVQESVEDFRKDDIVWSEFDPNEDVDVLLRQLRVVLTENIGVFRTETIIDENIAYMETLYDLIAILVNTPDNKGAIIQGIFAAQSAQTKFYVAVDEFLSSRLLAMRSTI